MKNKKTLNLSILALLLAFEIVLFLTPLGFIPVGPIRATTMHIPVIIAAIVLGVKGGAITGLVFGICSIVTNTLTPTPTSFVFSPFYSVGEFSGNFQSVIIAIVPRVLIGVVAALLYKWLTSKKVNESVSVITASISGALTSTFLVMGGIYVFFGESYAAARDVTYDALLGIIGTVISTNGITEAIVGAIVVLAAYKALKKTIMKNN